MLERLIGTGTAGDFRGREKKHDFPEQIPEDTATKVVLREKDKSEAVKKPSAADKKGFAAGRGAVKTHHAS